MLGTDDNFKIFASILVATFVGVTIKSIYHLCVILKRNTNHFRSQVFVSPATEFVLSLFYLSFGYALVCLTLGCFSMIFAQAVGAADWGRLLADIFINAGLLLGVPGMLLAGHMDQKSRIAFRKGCTAP